MSRQSQNVLNYRQRRKENLVRVSGGKCCLCGYDRTPSALEFHHIHPEMKKYGISGDGVCHDLESDLVEVQKCILVCANCHREIHHGMYTTEELEEKKVYLDDIANELREEKKQQGTKTVYYCKECGKPLSGNVKTHLCPECYQKSTRVVEHPTKQELKKLIRNTPFTQIAKIYGVSDNAIRKWCINEGLPSKKKDIVSYSDADWELL